MLIPDLETIISLFLNAQNDSTILLKVTFQEHLTSLLFNILEKFDKFFVTDAGPLLNLDQLVRMGTTLGPWMKFLVPEAGQEVDSEV